MSLEKRAEAAPYEPRPLLVDRKIIITGGASGIGKATALLFAQHGAKVAIFDPNATAAEDVARGVRGLACAIDVTDETALEDAVAEVAKQFGGIDGLVNAGAITFRGETRDASAKEWRRVIDVNLVGPFLTCRAAIPFLERASQATIVNVSSSAALLAIGGRAAYIAAKAGLIEFTRGLSKELGPRIRVNAICPGPVDTPLYHFANRNRPPEQGGATLALKRIAAPEEIARPILYLSCAQSSFSTGSVLVVDGGGHHPVI